MNDDTVSIDIHGAHVYANPMATRFRGITIREGMLIEGPAGWGEFCPFQEYDDREAAGCGAVITGYGAAPSKERARAFR